MNTVTTVEVRGYLVGDIWMPCAKASLPLCASVTDKRDMFSEPGATLRDCLLSILCANGGDFRNAELSGDTEIIVRRETVLGYGRSKVTRERRWPITSFPSIADMVDAETFGADCIFSEEDDG